MKRMYMLLFAAFSLTAAGIAGGGEINELKYSSLSQVIESLKSDDWQVRDSALVYGLLKYRNVDENGMPKDFKAFKEKDEVTINLIELLYKEIENAKRGGITKHRGEGYGEYLLDLLTTVAYLNDSRTLPVLIESVGVDVGWAKIVDETIAKYGEQIIEPMINKLKSSNKWAHSHIIFVLKEMLNMEKQGVYKISHENKELIKKELIKTMKSHQLHSTRNVSIWALEYIMDDEVIKALQDVCESDGYSELRYQSRVKTKKVVFPVREEARKALEKLGQK